MSSATVIADSPFVLEDSTGKLGGTGVASLAAGPTNYITATTVAGPPAVTTLSSSYISIFFATFNNETTVTVNDASVTSTSVVFPSVSQTVPAGFKMSALASGSGTVTLTTNQPFTGTLQYIAVNTPPS